MTTQSPDQESNPHAKQAVPSRTWVGAFGWVVAWVWAVVAGGGGFLLLLARGPLPLTNGWFALFSGVAACPLTATLSQKCLGVKLPGRVRIAAALVFLLAGRIALMVGSRVPWFSR